MVTRILDGIPQAFEDEIATNFVFGALMLQIPNLQQQARRQHGGVTGHMVAEQEA
jgi:hypothetical protein